MKIPPLKPRSKPRKKDKGIPFFSLKTNEDDNRPIEYNIVKSIKDIRPNNIQFKPGVPSRVLPIVKQKLKPKRAIL